MEHDGWIQDHRSGDVISFLAFTLFFFPCFLPFFLSSLPFSFLFPFLILLNVLELLWIIYVWCNECRYYSKMTFSLFNDFLLFTALQFSILHFTILRFSSLNLAVPPLTSHQRMYELPHLSNTCSSRSKKISATYQKTLKMNF